MEDRDIYRVFEQVKPPGLREAMLERLFSEERKRRPMKLMKKNYCSAGGPPPCC